MNAELAAMNKISRTVESAIGTLAADERDRVLSWFGDWLHAQRAESTKPQVVPVLATGPSA